MKKLINFGAVLVLVLAVCVAAVAENPCASPARRALVLSGGGIKGGFEAGVVYYLVVVKNCDFQDLNGISAGAHNVAFLAQAPQSEEATASQRAFARQTEELVELWESIKSPKQIVRGRFLAWLRYYAFKPVSADSLKDFKPMRRLLNENVSLERLREGRTVRVGVTSFYGGEYREVVFNPAKENERHFLDYVFASGVLPVLGSMPCIADGAADACTQYGDASVRRVSPLDSFFVSSAEGAKALPAHGPVQELFVVVTSPYQRGGSTLPVRDVKMLKTNARRFTSGKKITPRTVALMVDSIYHADLDAMWRANDMLRWRSANQDAGNSSLGGFPMESFNRDPAAPEISRPYTIALIQPEKETADIQDLLKLSPSSIREQLYCGCVAADQTMQGQFGEASQAGECARRFPPLADKRGTAVSSWPENACHAEPPSEHLVASR